MARLPNYLDFCGYVESEQAVRGQRWKIELLSSIYLHILQLSDAIIYTHIWEFFSIWSFLELTIT